MNILLEGTDSNFDIKLGFICFNSHKAVLHLAGTMGPLSLSLSQLFDFARKKIISNFGESYFCVHLSNLDNCK